MRLKKLLSIVMAAALACSAMVAVPPAAKTAEAAEYLAQIKAGETKTIASGTVDAGSAGATKIKVLFDCAEDTSFNQNSTINFKVTINGAPTDVDLTGSGWPSNGVKDNIGILELDSPLSANDTYTITAGINEWTWSGATDWVYGFTAVEFITDDTELTDVWVDNKDGSYSYTNSKNSGSSTTLEIPVSALTDENPENIISVTFSTPSGNGQVEMVDALGNVIKNSSNTQEGGTLQKGDNTFTVNGLKADSTIKFTCWWINKDGTETVKATVTTLQKDTLYKQVTVASGEEGSKKYSARFLKLVAKDSVADKSKAIFTINNGTKDIETVTTEYYTSITAAGGALTAPEGYVFLACAIKNIPEDITLELKGCVLE